jgi:hypothetical protein
MIRALWWRHTGRLRKRDNLLTIERGVRGCDRSRIILPQESLILCKPFLILTAIQDTMSFSVFVTTVGGGGAGVDRGLYLLKDLVACCNSFIYFTLIKNTVVLISAWLPLSRGPPLECLAEIRTRACLTASRRSSI